MVLQNEFIIKESALILVRRIIIFELLVFLLMAMVVSLLSYDYVRYIKNIITVVRFDVIEIVLISIIQIVTNFILFVQWNRERFDVQSREIVQTAGLFTLRRMSYSLKDVVSVEVSQNMLERRLSFGTIRLVLNGQKPLTISSIEHCEAVAGKLKLYIDRAKDVRVGYSSLSAKELLTAAESISLELKQTLRFNVKTNVVDKNMEKMVLKTITGFLNAVSGGHLLIGVADNGSIFGIHEDYKTLPRQDKDGFEKHLSQLIGSAIGTRYRNNIDIYFESVEGKDICLIKVRPSDEPAYLTWNNGEEFFVRAGNITAPLTLSETMSYIHSRWK